MDRVFFFSFSFSGKTAVRLVIVLYLEQVLL